MAVHARTGKHGRTTYYFDFVLDGQRHYATVGPSEKDARDAERVERGRALEHRLAIHWNIRRRRRESPTVQAFYATTWLPAARTTYPTTWRSGVSALRSLLAQCGHLKLPDVTSTHVELYTQHRLETIQPNSLHADCAWLRRFFEAALRAHHVRENPARGLILPRRTRRQYHLPTADEAQRLLTATGDVTVRDMIALTALLGLRRGEVTTVRREDVDFDAGVLAIWQPKTRKRKYLPMTGPVIDLMRRHLTSETPAERTVFVNRRGRPYAPTTFWGHFRRARIAAGLPRVRPHDLRHALATALLRGGEELSTVGAILGHDAPYHATMVYVGHTTEDRTRKALERLHEPETVDVTTLAGAQIEIRRLRREVAELRSHAKSARASS